MVPRIDLFGNPQAFIFIILPLIYYVWFTRYYHPNRLRLPISVPLKEVDLHRDYSIYFRFIPHIFKWLAFLCMVFALARPQQAGSITERIKNGMNIILILDISGSMETPDFPPNRLEAAKTQASAFVRGRKDDRMGIVLFAEDALAYAPLTTDHMFLEKMIDNIRIGMLPKEGTAIGQAIASGLNRLQASEDSLGIMILLTDGANNKGRIDPIAAARLSKSLNIRIYSIGIGTNSTSTESQKAAPTELDEGNLRSIANITNGAYFRADQPEGLSQIFKHISQLATKDYKETVYREITDLYPIFLGASLICMLLSALSMLTFIYNPLEH